MDNIKSALRPATDSEISISARLLHGQYDRLFKGIVSGGWDNESSGNVEAPCGFFALIIIERNECHEVWDAFGNEDYLDEGQLKWMWEGQLAGYYLTTENSDGIIHVWAYDEAHEARSAFNSLEEQYQKWDDETEEIMDLLKPMSDGQ